MLRTRITFAVLLTSLSLAPVQGGADGLFSRKPRLDEPKARALVETLKNDPDEKKRKAAADQLGSADPRLNPDVAPALVHALQRDASAAVRAEAAASLRELGEVFAQAAVALGEAAESDPAPAVRLAAQRALWAYHLSGYRTARGGDGLPAQTIEPPIASPVGPQQAVALVPAPPVPALPARVPPLARTSAPALPPVAAQPSPPATHSTMKMVLPNVLPGPRLAIRSMFGMPATPAPKPAPVSAPSGAPPVANLTAEPPLAKSATPPATLALPAPTPEPPAHEPPVKPDYVPTLPPFRPDLPSVVTPPWATPLPVPTAGRSPK